VYRVALLYKYNSICIGCRRKRVQRNMKTGSSASRIEENGKRSLRRPNLSVTKGSSVPEEEEFEMHGQANIKFETCRLSELKRPSARCALAENLIWIDDTFIKQVFTASKILHPQLYLRFYPNYTSLSRVKLRPTHPTVQWTTVRILRR
jgi:hypothetical protein